MTKYSYRHNEQQIIGAYCISELPGCTQVGVSHGVFLLPEFRGRGFGTSFGAVRLNHARNLLFDVVLGTIDENNIAQKKVAEKNGWIKFHTFVSSKTRNTVGLYYNQL